MVSISARGEGDRGLQDSPGDHGFGPQAHVTVLGVLPTLNHQFHLINFPEIFFELPSAISSADPHISTYVPFASRYVCTAYKLDHQIRHDY